jgi:hypothetical protein
MKKHDFIKNVSIMAALALSTSVFAAAPPPPVSLTPEGTQLEAQYSKMLADLKEAIKGLEPKVDEKKKATFVAAHAAVADVPPQPNPDGGKTLPRYAPSHKLYARGAGKRGGRGDCASFRSGSVPVGRQA